MFNARRISPVWYYCYLLSKTEVDGGPGQYLGAGSGSVPGSRVRVRVLVLGPSSSLMRRGWQAVISLAWQRNEETPSSRFLETNKRVFTLSAVRHLGSGVHHGPLPGRRRGLAPAVDLSSVFVFFAVYFLLGLIPLNVLG